jgi:hypothetical protein
MTAAVAGDHELTRELLAEQTAAGFERAKKNLEWLPSLGFLSHACAIVNDVPAAKVLYDELATSTARGIRIGPIAAWFAPIDHHLGALCRVMGRDQEAEARLRSAVQMCQQWKARPWLARSRAELAAVLDREGSQASRREASSLRTSAATLVAEIGAPGIVT